MRCLKLATPSIALGFQNFESFDILFSDQ